MSPTIPQISDLVSQIKAILDTSTTTGREDLTKVLLEHIFFDNQTANSMKLKKNHLTNLVKAIVQIIQKARFGIGQTVNVGMLLSYWQIGQLILQWENQFDTDANTLITNLSKILTQQMGKGFSRSNLYTMRKFALTFPDFEEVPLRLSWSHLSILLVIKDNHKRNFYIQESINSLWSVEELRRQVKSALFERLILAKDKVDKDSILKLAREGQSLEQPEDLLRQPYVLEFLNVPMGQHILEKELEQRILNHLQHFLLELGRGFMFVGSQKRVPFGNRMYYVDLVFYNKILKAYVLIDLKIDELSPGDVGQMNAYLNYYKTEVNDEDDNPPIGILLCADKHDVVAQYALGGLTNQILASTYTYYLPSEADLVAQVRQLLV